MTVWAGKFGGVAAATGLATIAGITYGNQISKNSTQQAINIQQMTAAQQGLQAMGVQAGTLGNDMQILTQQPTDQYKAVQNLNTGLATFIGNLPLQVFFGQTPATITYQGLGPNAVGLY